MSNTRSIPSANGTSLPTAVIYVGGKDVTHDIPLLSITVVHQANRISKAQIVLRDGDLAAEDFPLSNEDTFIPGETIEILAGYNNLEATIFAGIIIRQGIEFANKSEPILVLECRHEAVRMSVGRKNTSFKADTVDSDIIRAVIDRNPGLTAQVESTAAQNKEMIQYYVSDWDFVITRAEMNGMLVYTQGSNTVAVRKPDPGAPAGLSLTSGDTIYSFQATMDARYQYPKVRSISWDYSEQKVVEGEGRDPGIQEQGNLSSSQLASVLQLNQYDQVHSGQVTDQELAAWSEATMLRSRLAKTQGTVRIQGTYVLPGETLDLRGIGNRFNGNVLVTRVLHEFNIDNWETEIEFGMSRNWISHDFDDVVERDAAALVPSIPGLQIGKVVKIEEDPDQEHRILVRLPVIETNESDGVWARIATLDAGENRGTFFLPEENDEVILGFLNGDPRDPVILGMLHSSARPAPLTAEAENSQKGFVTKSEMKLLFDDSEKSITLETPAGNKIVINEEDKSITWTDANNNQIVSNDQGITLESLKDINLFSQGAVNIEGLEVNILANTNLTAEATAQATFQSNGITVIKGSLVQIN